MHEQIRPADSLHASINTERARSVAMYLKNVVDLGQYVPGHDRLTKLTDIAGEHLPESTQTAIRDMLSNTGQQS